MNPWRKISYYSAPCLCLFMCLSLSVAVVSGCALTDGWLTKKTTTTNEDGETETFRDWTSPVKFVANNIPGVAGTAASVLLTIGGIVMGRRSRRKRKEQEIIAAGSMAIVKAILEEAEDVIAQCYTEGGDKTKILDLPDKLWEIVKIRAAKYKKLLKDPAQWEAVLSKVREILSKSV